MKWVGTKKALLMLLLAATAGFARLWIGGSGKLNNHQDQSESSCDRRRGLKESEFYPRDFRNAEQEYLRIRRDHAGISEDAEEAGAIGFALSGGGIRSATFCLGVFQTLAQLRLIHRIDFLSTVSGGGYFGSFLGRLFTRLKPNLIEDRLHLRPSRIEGLLHPIAATRRVVADSLGLPDPVQALRRNGRYLAPQGSADVLLGFAVVIRNWVAIHVVLVTWFLALFLAAQLLRAWLEIQLPGWTIESESCLTCYLPGSDATLWWSPYIGLIPPILVLWAIPAGWAYWVLADDVTGGRAGCPRVSALCITLLSLAALVIVIVPFDGVSQPWSLAGVREFIWSHPLSAFGAVLLICGVLALIAYGVVLYIARAGIGGQDQVLNQDAEARNRVSRWLKYALIALLCVAGFAIVDTLGQTIYAILTRPGDGLGTWLTSLIGGLLALAAGARPIAMIFGGQDKGKRLGRFSGILAIAAGLFVATIALTAVDTISHAIVWDFKRPHGAPDGLAAPEPMADQAAGVRALQDIAKQLTDGCQSGAQQPGCPGSNGVEARERLPGCRKTKNDKPMDELVRCPDEGLTWDENNRDWQDLRTAIATFIAALILSGLFGISRVFVNNSSHHAFYAARLTRAYLGASNPKRRDFSAKLTDVVADDDITPAEYWDYANSAILGAPLHLINVTINQTLDERTNIQHQDRKGIGMAVGPAGISVGLRQHANFDWPASAEGLVEARIAPEKDGQFRVFGDLGYFQGESLTLGSWAAISGAAFTTGLGTRTNLGLSLLAGMGNVRLGYWWDSGVTRAGGWMQWLRACFPCFGVQRALVAEFVARFRGTQPRHWHLTDGGHFENMGAYELIRRRVPLMVVIDAEADPDFEFAGLANLVRKARIDFQAEIEFVDEDNLADWVGNEPARHFGPLKHLQRGRWQEEPFEEPARRLRDRLREILHQADRRQLSRAHAALALVCYDGEPEPSSVLLYLKPTLIGNEPADLVEYHARYPDFPHETTADQFFGEAQWESYRKLGEHIASQVFAPDLLTDLLLKLKQMRSAGAD